MEFIIAGGAIAAALGAIWNFIIRPVGRGVKALSDTLEKLDDVATRLEVVEQQTKQLTNNGGSHMKDVVERTERKIDIHLEDCRMTHSDIRLEMMTLAANRNSHRQ